MRWVEQLCRWRVGCLGLQAVGGGGAVRVFFMGFPLSQQLPGAWVSHSQWQEHKGPKPTVLAVKAWLMSHPLTFHWPKQAIWSKPKQWTGEDYSSDSGRGMQSNMAMAVFVYNPVTGVKEWGQESSPLQAYPQIEVVFLLLQKPSSISEWRRWFLNVAPYLFDFLQNPFCNQPFIFVQLCFHCHFSKQVTASQRTHGFCVCSISVDESASQDLSSSDLYVLHQHPSCLLEWHFNFCR